MIIDTHSHLNDKQFSVKDGPASGGDLDEVIMRMKMANVSTITVGTDYEMSKKAIEIAEKYNWWATVGQHPADNKSESFDYVKYLELAKNERVVGIGECGLDYYHDKTEEGRIRQKKLFEQQIELALEVGKPLMLHVRDAYEDVLTILNSYFIFHNSKLSGNVHFFSGTWQVAKKFLDMNFTLSFSGTITFSHQYDEVVKNVSDDMFMVETDSPYVLPEPYRGLARAGLGTKRNEPAFVVEVIKKIAQLRGDNPEHIIELTARTTSRVFGFGLQI